MCVFCFCFSFSFFRYNGSSLARRTASKCGELSQYKFFKIRKVVIEQWIRPNEIQFLRYACCFSGPDYRPEEFIKIVLTDEIFDEIIENIRDMARDLVYPKNLYLGNFPEVVGGIPSLKFKPLYTEPLTSVEFIIKTFSDCEQAIR